MSNVIKITKENFDEMVMQSETPILVQFSAEWCGPCRMLGPIIDKLSVDNEGNNIKIVKINVDESSDLASKYGVRGIPCVIALKDGVEVQGSRKTGVQPVIEYQNLIDSLV